MTSVKKKKAARVAKPRAASRPPRAEVSARAALLSLLTEHALGRHEMTASQVTVALALLKLPPEGKEATTAADPVLAHEEALAALLREEER